MTKRKFVNHEGREVSRRSLRVGAPLCNFVATVLACRLDKRGQDGQRYPITPGTSGTNRQAPQSVTTGRPACMRINCNC
jgi:hypothetical protein